MKNFFSSISIILIVSINVIFSETQKNEVFKNVFFEEPPCLIVIFGASGDLSAKKLFPALYHLYNDHHLPEQTIIVGIARQEKTHDQFRNEIQEAIQQYCSQAYEKDLCYNFCNKIFYLEADFNQNNGFKKLKEFITQIEKKHNTLFCRLFYLATSPNKFSTIIEKLKNNELISKPEEEVWSRIIIEKPFGYDLESAKNLQYELSSLLDEDQLYRIDHYLGKTGVENLIDFRFKKGLLEPIWNHTWVDHVQITLGESIGIGSRAEFWEETGYLRDIFQNHLMQLLALVAMEKPITSSFQNIHKERIKLLKSVRPFPLLGIEEFVIRGQYTSGYVNGAEVDGYKNEKGVPENSGIETFIASKLFIDNDRWKDVPFYVRGGKRLPYQTTEIALIFKNNIVITPNVTLNGVFIRIQPHPSIFLKMSSSENSFNSLCQYCIFNDYLNSESIPSQDAYEKLILDCLRGDKKNFVDYEEQLTSWELLTPLLKHWKLQGKESLFYYPAGTWGPEIKNPPQWQLIEN